MTFRPRSILQHKLSFAVLISDHFTGRPIQAPLQVSLDGWDAAPVRSPSGSPRHPDGTWRWIDLPDGTYDVQVVDPSGQWRFERPAATLVVPLAAPSEPARVEGWPTQASPDPLGLTALRILLHDPALAPLAGLRVSVGPAGGPFLRSTQSEADGELLFWVVEPMVPAADGSVTLEVQVEGGARPVLSAAVGGATPTAGPLLAVSPGRATRVRVEVGP